LPSRAHEKGVQLNVRPILWLIVWACAACLGVLAWTNLGNRLSSSIEVPGSEAQRASHVLESEFRESTAGSFAVLFEAPPRTWSHPEFVKQVRVASQRAAEAAGGRATALETVGPRTAFASIPTDLDSAEAQSKIPEIDAAIGHIHGARIRLTGFPVVTTEVNSLIDHDLRRAEVIAIPITAVILLLLFGSLPAVAIPLIFSLATISAAFGLIWIESLFIEIPIYATSVVTLVGIALAVDYSMLYVARYREERAAGAGSTERLLETTARTSGRALLISGVVVAAGLFPLAFIPIPFFSGLGLAALVIPLVSALAALTLLPSLLAVIGPHLDRLQIQLPRRAQRPGRNAVDRLAAAVMRRPGSFAFGASLIMLLLAFPAFQLELSGGSAEFLRRAGFANQSHSASSSQAGAALAPSEVLIDGGEPGGAWTPAVLGPERRLLNALAIDPGVASIQSPAELAFPFSHGTRHALPPGESIREKAKNLGLVSSDARFLRLKIQSSYLSGTKAAEDLIGRIRDDYLPSAAFGSARTWVGGPAAGDFAFAHGVSESILPLALGIAVVMFFLLAAMLRSFVLPLKAIVMSALSVAAACGVLVVVFQAGLGEAIGLLPSERIAAWVPVLLFAALFGISTDYEIFMVTRMREEWKRSGDNESAISIGLHRISRVITASALVMIVIFAGFTTSRVVALQQFGVGLVAGVVLDATVVRLILVPATMKLLGRWNWSLLPMSAGPSDQPPASRLQRDQGR